MAAMPMQARLHTPMMMQPTRARSFMQPAQAAKSPVAGLMEIEVPLGRKEELDIIVPVTKREEMTMTKRQMVTNALAAAASVLPFAANAKLETDEAPKKREAFLSCSEATEIMEVSAAKKMRHAAALSF